MYTYLKQLRGITLIESLIALVIVSIGLLAVARLHGDLIAGSSLSKARTEAVQLANAQLEEMRTRVMEADCTALASFQGATTSITGTNAAMTRTIALTHTANPDRLGLVVSVAWTDAKSDSHTVSVQSEVVCDDPLAAGSVAKGVLPGGGIIDSPTGRARMGEGTVDPETLRVEDQNLVPSNSGDIHDGTYTYIDGDEVKLVGEDGYVIMTMYGSTPEEGFSTINGRVYFDDDMKAKDVDPENMLVISSDASHCTRIFSDGSDYGSGHTGGNDFKYTLFSDEGFDYFIYQCYVGEGWYGNIGIHRLGSAPGSDRICVGRSGSTVPAEGSVVAWENTFPALSTRRQYRSYEKIGSVYRAVGIGVDPAYGDNGNGDRYEAEHYEDHHFLLAEIKGKAVDKKCEDPLDEKSALFASNSGRHFCMNKDDRRKSLVCADTTEISEGGKPILSIKGRITLGGNQHNPLLVTELNIDGIPCAVGSRAVVTGSVRYDYICELSNVDGYTADSWEGNLSISYSEAGKICHIVPSTASGYLKVGNRFENGLDGDLKSRINFSGLPLADVGGEAEESEEGAYHDGFNFTIHQKGSNCPNCGTNICTP
ncbi:prepilin-type N-terminal cleavage/methylation domain-containing protein [Thiorhodospira sibirica]|uniref:prepilin-type N-terminal cleavage/methylation domain-containing protein n=1 Tax=Thiorhodospira sibirica TaxID=154347 RepID=UPI00022C5DDA|nr:prepilin-type N-terminal cleavage/methylation domain-containing protein [Thiorhodospira sibirica]